MHRDDASWSQELECTLNDCEPSRYRQMLQDVVAVEQIDWLADSRQLVVAEQPLRIGYPKVMAFFSASVASGAISIPIIVSQRAASRTAIRPTEHPKSTARFGLKPGLT